MARNRLTRGGGGVECAPDLLQGHGEAVPETAGPWHKEKTPRCVNTRGGGPRWGIIMGEENSTRTVGRSQGLPGVPFAGESRTFTQPQHGETVLRPCADGAGGAAAPGAEGPPYGLVYSCISARKDTPARLLAFARDVQVKRFRATDKPRKSARRGRCGAFTRDVARRLRHFGRNCGELVKASETGRAAFAHLTYPGEFPTDGRTVKRHLHAFIQWCRRKGVYGLWAVEFQARGAPHLHLVLTGHIDKGELAEAWYRIVASGDERHLAAGTRIEAVQKPYAIPAYIAGYVSKQDQKSIPAQFVELGRWWGHWGTTCEPVAEVSGTVAELAKLTRVCKQAGRAGGRTVAEDRIARECRKIDRGNIELIAKEHRIPMRDIELTNPATAADLEPAIIKRARRCLRKRQDRGSSFTVYGAANAAMRFLRERTIERRAVPVAAVQSRPIAEAVPPGVPLGESGWFARELGDGWTELQCPMDGQDTAEAAPAATAPARGQPPAAPARPVVTDGRTGRQMDLWGAVTYGKLQDAQGGAGSGARRRVGGDFGSTPVGQGLRMRWGALDAYAGA